jgi:hypothetical protein
MLVYEPILVMGSNTFYYGTCLRDVIAMLSCYKSILVMGFSVISAQQVCLAS